MLLALLLQVGPNPLAGDMMGDELVRDRPPRPSADLAQTPAEPSAASVWLAECLDQIATDPARAHTIAQIRRGETRGTDRILANHCLGTAASQLGLWNDARTAFVAAREETPPDEPRARARFAAMAGNAALAGGDGEAAIDLLVLAESDASAAGATPMQAIAVIDRARALVMLDRSAEALDALFLATTLAPDRAEGWLLQATLLRRLDRLDEAQAAIERAVAAAPDPDGIGPDIGLEAGLIAVLSGRDAAARQSWQSVIALAPDSPAARTAQEYLAQLPPADNTAATPQDQPPKDATP